jgi:DNA-binding response OmpR family regulator
VHYVRNSADALQHLRRAPVDVLMTEWQLQPLDGLGLIHFVRHDKQSPNRAMAIIMMTGRGERPDVEMARDMGVDEFLVKPFTVQTLYQRLERVIDQPRAFVLAMAYAGPDRRRRRAEAVEANRRQQIPMLIAVRGNALPMPDEKPILLPPNYYLKGRIGLRGPLASVVTPERIAAAQLVIDMMEEQSERWIREDFSMLDVLMREHSTVRLEETALSLKSRAGIFGHRLLSEVARVMHLFLRGIFDATRAAHWAFVDQCTDLMKIIFAQEMREIDQLGCDLLGDLRSTMAQL